MPPLRDDQNKPQVPLRAHINFYGPGTHSPERGHRVGNGKMEGQRGRQCCQPSHNIMQSHWPAALSCITIEIDIVAFSHRVLRLFGT